LTDEQLRCRTGNVTTTHELVSLFAYLIDERRFDAVEALVTPDLIFENSRGIVTGWPAVRSGMEALTVFKATQHFLGNHIGWWEGEDFFGKTYCIASHLYDEQVGERKYEMGICYEEHIVRVDGALKLRRRKLNLLWQQDVPTTRQPPEAFLAAMMRTMPSKGAP
jgi:hypothetical protein